MKNKVDPKGLVIVANYNQHLEIEKYLGECGEALPKEMYLVVDDGSTDGSDAIAERMGFQVLRHGRNRGIGAALRTGIEYASAQGKEWVLITSSNGKMVPAEFSEIFLPVSSGEVDYVQGSRFLDLGRSPGLPRFRRWAIPVFSILTSLVLGRRFSDVTCGLRAYRIHPFLNHAKIHLNQDWLDRYELEYYIHYHAVRTLNLRIREVPVTIRYDHLGEGRKSKIKPIVGWWSMIRPFVYLALGVRK